MYMIWDELDRINNFFDDSVFNNINYITNFNDEINRIIKWKRIATKDADWMRKQIRNILGMNDDGKNDTITDSIMRSTQPHSIPPATPGGQENNFPALNKLKKLAEAGKLKIKLPENKDKKEAELPQFPPLRTRTGMKRDISKDILSVNLSKLEGLQQYTNNSQSRKLLNLRSPTSILSPINHRENRVDTELESMRLGKSRLNSPTYSISLHSKTPMNMAQIVALRDQWLNSPRGISQPKLKKAYRYNDKSALRKMMYENTSEEAQLKEWEQNSRNF